MLEILTNLEDHKRPLPEANQVSVLSYDYQTLCLYYQRAKSAQPRHLLDNFIQNCYNILVYLTTPEKVRSAVLTLYSSRYRVKPLSQRYLVNALGVYYSEIVLSKAEGSSIEDALTHILVVGIILMELY